MGNSGWSFDDLAPYYQKFATRHDPSDETRRITRIGGRNEASTGDGPIQLSYGEEFSPLNSAWMDAWATFGLGPASTNGSAEAEGVLGAFQNTSAVDPALKIRSYAGLAHYGTAQRQRNNLVVLTNTLVHKIVFEGQDPEAVATGVQIQTKGGSLQTVRARREVILAAGALQSPQLLELSGIGRKDLLKSHDIPVVVDNANVGEHLQDHAMVCQSYQIKDGLPSVDTMRDPEAVQAAVVQYSAERKGPLTSVAASSAYAPIMDESGRVSMDAKRALLNENVRDSSIRSTQLKKLLARPNQGVLSPMIFACQMHQEDSDPPAASSYVAPTRPENYFTIVSPLGHPFSRGSCHIQSPDANAAPEINPAYLTQPADVEILARMVLFVEKLTSTEPIKSLARQPDGARMPESAPDDLEKAREVVRTRLMSNMHVCGTCGMLPREQGGVVDERLIVYGTKNLRIVDASIFPLIPLGNILTTGYAVAEKAADLIKGHQK